MKKLLFSIFAIGTMLSCSDDALEQDGNRVNLTFTASMEDDNSQSDGTRTSLDPETMKRIFWDEGDAISVFDGSFNSHMLLLMGAGTASGIFTGNCEKADEYYAVYPYNEGNSDEDGRNIRIVWNGSRQVAVKGSFPKGTPMLAYTVAPEGEYYNIDLKFKNVCSFLKFTIDYECLSATIVAKDKDCMLTADALYIGKNDKDTPTIDGVTSSYNSVTLVADESGVIQPGTYYVAVMPTVMTGGFAITFTSATSIRQVEAKSTTKDVTLTRNGVLNLGAIDLTKFATELEGDGTSEKPYLIHNFAELHRMQLNIAAGKDTKACYKQMADIDASGLSIEPIGDATHNFEGTYDGNGKKISNIKYSKSISYEGTDGADRQAFGLFGIIKDASICDLTIENPVFVAPSTTNQFSASPFVAVAHGSNTGKCQLTNLVTNSTSAVKMTTTCSTKIEDTNGLIYGGMIADSEANVDISNCKNNMETDFAIQKYSCSYDCGHINVGGIIGCAAGVNDGTGSSLSYDGTVNVLGCRSDGKIYLNEDPSIFQVISYMGGFIGNAVDFTWDDDVVCNIKNCVHSGALECYPSTASCSAWLGGMIGYQDSDGFGSTDPIIENCINSGDILGGYETHVGGILGYCYDDDTKVNYCANSGYLAASSLGKSYFPCSLSYYHNYDKVGSLPSGDYFFDTYSPTWQKYTFPTDFGDEDNWQNSSWQKTVDEVVSLMNTLIEGSPGYSAFYKWQKSNNRCDLISK